MIIPDHEFYSFCLVFDVLAFYEEFLVSEMQTSILAKSTASHDGYI